MSATATKIENEAVGEELAKLREQLRVPVKEVCSSTGISPNRLRAIEKGADLKLSELIGLAKAYDYTPKGLVGRIVK